MKLHRIFHIAALVAILISSGCEFGLEAIKEVKSEVEAVVSTSTPTLDVAATQQAQQTLDAQATSAQGTAFAQATLDFQATSRAAEGTKIVLDRQATATASAARKQTAAAAVAETATAQVANFLTVLQNLFDAGKIDTIEGKYVRLEDFEDTQAKLNYFFPTPTGQEAENFVLSADLTWSSASMKANWPTSGCGFLYGVQDDRNRMLTFLGLDGYVYSLGWVNGAGRAYAFKKWGKPSLPEGNAKSLLLVFDKRVTIYVNDALANEFYLSTYKPGEIGLTVVSGTNAGYGTRCQMTNLELWIFK